MFQKELPLVAFLEQETFAFFIPGFTLQSGLGLLFSQEIQFKITVYQKNNQ